ncbi:ECF-type riboflavin transporter substrate-binding protein [Melissococcus plutonius]|uniref:ECF-type riboflavin transporter substrate-binding protein n=1 Tax=Melissococcus plutonius TaxID=33970 RepID=UPI00065DC9DF|nr:ECF-type riboflavin transporter substrate-binding protein [Melissococcus plutonius]KMT32123.1 putative membrane protein [Melissococcus plutonius]KMT34694.1 putative membrane protein [Melissococcus plutonius]BBD15111.1 substrate-specific component MtsA of methionine-regulated ECF transporter [Melissococcus plutonius]
MKKSLSVKTIVAIGIGSAVFVILGRFVVIPTGFPNTNLETCYPFLALMSIVFGPIAGGLIGLIGHTLKDLTTYGSAWWSWIFCSGMIGMIYGFIGKKLSIQHGLFPKKELIYFSICQIIGNLIIWDGLAPTLDVLIYSEPANKVFTQGIIAVILNVLSMAIFGTLLLSTYAAKRVKKGSLKKEW